MWTKVDKTKTVVTIQFPNKYLMKAEPMYYIDKQKPGICIFSLFVEFVTSWYIFEL